MIDRAEYVVEDEAHRLRIDRFLAKIRPDLTRRVIASLIRTGAVRIAGQPVRDGYYVKRGQKIEILPTRPATSYPPREIVRSADAIAIAKPPGLNTNPVHGSQENLLAYLRQHLERLGISSSAGILHRLDRDTSGLVLFSLSPVAHQALEEAFRSRSIRKTYLALISGSMHPRHGTITRPLARHPSGRMHVDPHGSPARTDYRTQRASRGASLLEIRPYTGRTHQIRVHLASVGRPIAGDPIYGDPRHTLGAPRLWLHAVGLDLPPALASQIGLPSKIQCPLWEDLAAHLAHLGIDSIDYEESSA
jgi:23S rRNA pseudouridine1911/1915/1917 synthase